MLSTSFQTLCGGVGVCYQRRFKLYNVWRACAINVVSNLIMCGVGVCYQCHFKLYNVWGGRVLSTSFQTS